MGATGLFHHVGTFFFLAATVLLLIASISSPVIGDIGILKVTLTNKTDFRNSSVTFGTFGHCVLDVAPVQTDQDFCYPKTIGYHPADIMSQIDQTTFTRAGAKTANDLTKVMILHPVACVLAFIAFCVSIGASVVGSLMAFFIGVIAWIVTVVVMAVDFSLFGIIKNHVNHDGSGSHAYYSVGMWAVLASMILLFLAMFIVLFTCCSARRKKRSGVGKVERNSHTYNDGYATNDATRRSRFGRFGRFGRRNRF